MPKSPAKGSPQKKGSVSTRLRKRLKESSTNNSASDKDTGQDMYVPNPGPQALSDFVMGTDHAGSSQESQAESLPEEGETDLENSSGPDEVKKHCQIIKRLSSRFGLTPSDVLQALWANSGSLRNTVHWILYGVDTSGCPAWSEEDDELLGSTRSEDLNALRNKYGTQRVHQRAAFLEDSSLK
ncbi:uncharacterized protein LOC135473387 [Liolophura sinensis]|uniref:uncharacterized protein LOC135473387 n=1 Tax=Liolophura sinensis TaxID=3198878 RepID=UPI0031581362